MGDVVPFAPRSAARTVVARELAEPDGIAVSYVADLHATRALCTGAPGDTAELVWLRGVLAETLLLRETDAMDLVRALDAEVARRFGA